MTKGPDRRYDLHDEIAMKDKVLDEWIKHSEAFSMGREAGIREVVEWLRKGCKNEINEGNKYISDTWAVFIEKRLLENIRIDDIDSDLYEDDMC